MTNNNNFGYTLHGILQIIAFAILFPLGIAFAIFRNKIGSNWFIYHVTTQTIGLLVVITALLVIYFVKKKSKKNFEKNFENKNKKIHEILGPIVVLLLFFQFIWALIIKKFINRFIWYYIHISLSFLIITGGLINIYFGINIYK
jgi:phosphate starvation-inducible membrane PsiE